MLYWFMQLLPLWVLMDPGMEYEGKRGKRTVYRVTRLGRTVGLVVGKDNRWDAYRGVGARCFHNGSYENRYQAARAAEGW